MNKFLRFIRALLAAITVAFMGLFCAMAGGVQWGTDTAGLIAAMTCTMMIFAFGETLSITSDL